MTNFVNTQHKNKFLIKIHKNFYVLFQRNLYSSSGKKIEAVFKNCLNTSLKQKKLSINSIEKIEPIFLSKTNC